MANNQSSVPLSAINAQLMSQLLPPNTGSIPNGPLSALTQGANMSNTQSASNIQQMSQMNQIPNANHRVGSPQAPLLQQPQANVQIPQQIGVSLSSSQLSQLSGMLPQMPMPSGQPLGPVPPNVSASISTQNPQIGSLLSQVNSPPSPRSIRKRKESGAICNNCAASGMMCSDQRPCHSCVQRNLSTTCVDIDHNKRRELGPQSSEPPEDKQGLLGSIPNVSDLFAGPPNPSIQSNFAPSPYPMPLNVQSQQQAPMMNATQHISNLLQQQQQRGIGMPMAEPALTNRPALNYTSEEIIIMVESLQTWRPNLDVTDAPTLRRFIWLWRAVSTAVRYFWEHNKNVSVDNLVSKMHAIASGITFEALDRARANDTPAEDTFFDKTVQTLVHEHLPMGVLMLHFGPVLLSEDNGPVVNSMACELFGFSRSEFANLLQDIRGWHRIYYKNLYLDVFRRFMMALATGTDSYVFNAMYVHKNGFLFEGLESRRIWYGKDGVPTYATVYIQKCDNVTTNSPLITQEASPGTS